MAGSRENFRGTQIKMDKQNNQGDDFNPKALYPEAQPIFGFKLEHIEGVKDEALIVLDTNALLVPYTVGKQSLEEIEKTYRSLIAKNRLIIPGQVAREFAKHRATKLGEVFQQLSTKRDSLANIDTGEYPLLESFPEYKDILGLQRTFNEQIAKYRKTIGTLLEKIRVGHGMTPLAFFTASSSEVMSFLIQISMPRKS
jgi:hypothetical protein